MAGIDPIMWHGQETYIDKSNAKDIYLDFRRGNVDLSTAQEHYAANMLTDEDWDEIEYDTEIKNKEAKDKINTDGTESGDNVPDNAQASVAVSAGSGIAALLVAAKALKAPTSSSGWTALACGILASGVLAVTALALSFRNIFDPDSGTREARAGESDGSISEIDQYKDGLEDGMDLMSEDMENYQNLNQTLTNTMSVYAAMIADAEANGDNAKAAKLRKEMEELVKGQSDELAATKGGLNEYGAYNVESQSIRDAGTQVSEFLQVGNTLKTLADINGYVLAAVAGIFALYVGLAATSAKTIFDLVPSTLGSVLFGVAAGLFGTASGKMFSNANFEQECGNAGDNMADHLKDLNGMIDGNQKYIETTGETYEKNDEKQDENREKGQEAANKIRENASVPTGKDGQDSSPQPVA